MARPRTSKSTIGRDPWGTVIPTPDDTEYTTLVERESPRVRRKRRATPAPTVAPAVKVEPIPPPHPPTAGTATETLLAVERPGREKLTVHLDGALVNRVKNAAYWNPRLTIARIAEAGIRLAIEQVERDNGGAYPRREAELLGGRPIK